MGTPRDVRCFVANAASRNRRDSRQVAGRARFCRVYGGDRRPRRPRIGDPCRCGDERSARQHRLETREIRGLRNAPAPSFERTFPSTSLLAPIPPPPPSIISEPRYLHRPPLALSLSSLDDPQCAGLFLRYPSCRFATLYTAVTLTTPFFFSIKVRLFLSSLFVVFFFLLLSLPQLALSARRSSLHPPM